MTETYYPVVGGGETQTQRLAEGLSARGFGVLVLTRRSDPALAKSEHFGAVEIGRLPPAGGGHLMKWGLLLTAFLRLLRLRREYDVILVSGYRVLGLPAVLASRLLRIPCVLKADSLGEWSGAFFRDGLARLRLRPTALPMRAFLAVRNRLLQQADAFVAISSPVYAELAAGGVNPEHVHRLPNSVDTSQFCPVDRADKVKLRARLCLPAAATIVTYAGRLVSYKGLPLLAHVWREIRHQHPNALLVLVGAGGLDLHNCEAELRALVSANDLQESVLFAGDVRNVHEYLQASDLFVLPTEREAFGIALIEAMACGLPVIATATGGLIDIVDDRQNGLLIPVTDFRALFDALHQLMSDPALAARLGQAARRTVCQRYSAEVVTQRYVDLLARVRASALPATPALS